MLGKTGFKPYGMASVLALTQPVQCDGLSTEQMTNLEDILACMQGLCRLLSLLGPMFAAIEDKEMQLGNTMPIKPMSFVRIPEQPS